MCIDAKSECRFWAKVDRSHGNDACWNWLADRDKDGYGSFKAHGRQWRAHRVAYALTHGEISDGLIVRHACDNPRCCNPRHLLLGTQADNMKDKCERNRQLRGADDGNSKLCDDDVRRILASPECHARVARRHKISAVNVQMIRDGKTWIHVERPAIAVGYEDGRFGENSVHHKLTHADALAILASGETQSALAKKYQVDQATISNIKRGKYWKRAYAEFHTGA